MSNTNPRDQHNAANALSNEQGGEFATTSIHRTSDEDTSVQSTPDQVNPSPIKPLENKSLEAHVTHPSSDQSSPIQEPEVTIAYGHNTPTILDPQQQSVFATDIYIDSHKRSEESLGRTKKELAKDFGDYELLGEIARGGMGVVYRARQKGLNRIVALKMILAGNLASEIDIKRFYTEAEAAAKLDHPGIVPIYEVNQKDDQHYFAMGFIDGPSLSAKIREQTFTPRQSAEIAIAIADAVEYAHQQGIIHRDLKPQNILLTSNGQPKVTDFGLAKHLGNESDLTSSGQILGTPNYMAPEQASGNTEDIGPQADVYALGGILYCMLVGKPPFQGKNLADTLQQVQFTEATPPSKLNPKVHRDLETICMKALSKTPSLRYQTAAQFADDLRRFCDGEPILGRREGWYSFLIRRAKRNTVASAAIAIVGAVVLLASLLVWRSSDAYQLASLNQRLQVELDSMELSDEKLKSMDAIAASIAKIAPDNFQYTSKRINDKLVATLYQKINQPRLDPSNLQQIETWIDIVGQRSESSVAGLQDAYQARIRTWETVLELKPPFTDSPKAFPTLSRSDHNDSLFASSLIPTFHLSTIPGKGDTVFEAEFEPNDTHQIIGLVLSTSPGHRQLISSAAFLKNNTELLTGAANIIHGHPGELILWEVHTGKTLKTFALPVSGTPLIRILADSNTVILAMKDQSRIWKMDLEKGIWNEWFTYPDGAIITSLELASKSNILALTVYHTDASRSVDTWKLSVPNPSIPENRTLCKSYVELLKINPTGEEILWYSDKTIHLQNFVSNAAPLEIACDNLKNVNDELSVALVQMDGYLELWNMKTDKKVPLPKKEASYCTDSSFSPDGELVAITSDFRETVFRVSNGKSVNEFSNSDLNLQDITCRSQFSLNSAYLLLATKDGSFFIRDRKLHKLLPRYGFSGYSFLLKFPEYLEGQARPEKGLLQILRNRSILRSEEVRLPGDQLHITARRENDLLSIQLNDLPPIEFREIFPLSNNESTVIGVVTSATDKITSIRARKRTQSANLSKLESADMVYGSGDFEQARQLYSTYTLDNFDLATVQESLFKQALCLIELDRAAEADELLSNLVTQNGDHWPPMAACQLWLRRIRQNKSAEADELLDFLTSRFRFEELVGMIPEEAREEIIALYRDVAVSSKLFLPNPSRIQQAERSLAVQKLFFGFGGEMHMIRALHIAGRLEEATEYAEQFVQTGNKQAMKAENLVGCIQEYIWLLQLQGKAREALEAINRIETESFSHGTWLPDNAWAPDKVRLLYAMGKSAEAIAMARNEISAINASLSSPLPKSKLVYARANTTLLQTMAAMLLEEQGDTESAKKFWLNQPEENWELNDLNIETIHNHILASRGKTMTVEQSQRFLNRILRSMGDMGKMMEATGIMATVAPGFAELFESKRGKQVAFDFVFRTHPLSNYIRSYPQLVAYETVRRSILLPESPEYHDQIIWETCKDGCDLYMDGKLSSGVVVPLALSWKGTNGFLGWGAASPTLPKDFRARAAFVLGVRYERLGRAKDAITFFQQASRDGTDVTGLPEAAQKEIERLQTLVQ